MQLLPKITDLEETRSRTVYLLDDNGERYRDAEEIIVKRKVKTVTADKRFLHYAIDYLLIYGILYLVEAIYGYVLTSLDENVSSVISFTTFFSFPFFFGLATYYMFFEFLFQKTPGKFITKTVVIDEYGNKPDFKQVMIRSFVRYIPFEAFSCIGETENRSYGWHDKWSETWVVTDEELKNLRKLQLENSNGNS